MMNSTFIVRTQERLEALQAAAVALLVGLALVFVTGFAHPTTIHNAAHDTRHSLSFPCHWRRIMITRVLTVGLLAGLLAGLAIAVLQQFTTSPLILAAEVFEDAAKKSANAASMVDSRVSGSSWSRALGARLFLVHEHGPSVAGQPREAEGWKPANGLPRFFYTSIATIATAVGFAMLLLSGMIMAGDEINERRALMWAIAAFVAMGFAPALGLPPELPGSAAGPIVARQVWWVGTAAATALALWMALRFDNVAVMVASAFLFAVPHMIGAPHAGGYESRAPAELAAQFAATSLGVQAALWVAVSLAAGALWQWFERREAPWIVEVWIWSDSVR
jgi:cobalt transporter subunit CbtA/cobalt transporter subunit CbtB